MAFTVAYKTDCLYEGCSNETLPPQESGDGGSGGDGDGGGAMVPPAVTGTYLWHGSIGWCVSGMRAPKSIGLF
jgi:hypothetical protein